MFARIDPDGPRPGEAADEIMGGGERRAEQRRGDDMERKPVQPRPVDQNEVPDNAARAYSQAPVGWYTGRL